MLGSGLDGFQGSDLISWLVRVEGTSSLSGSGDCTDVVPVWCPRLWL